MDRLVGNNKTRISKVKGYYKTCCRATVGLNIYLNVTQLLTLSMVISRLQSTRFIKNHNHSLKDITQYIVCLSYQNHRYHPSNPICSHKGSCCLSDNTYRRCYTDFLRMDQELKSYDKVIHTNTLTHTLIKLGAYNAKKFQTNSWRSCHFKPFWQLA
jgi:hypothetical protein